RVRPPLPAAPPSNRSSALPVPALGRTFAQDPVILRPGIEPANGGVFAAVARLLAALAVRRDGDGAIENAPAMFAQAVFDQVDKGQKLGARQRFVAAAGEGA